MSANAKLIEEMRAGLDGVTPGPWRIFVPDRGYCQNLVLTDAPEFAPDKDKGPWKHLVADCDDCARGEVNAAHIARCSPENIRAILNTIARMEEENGRLGGLLDRIVARDDRNGSLPVWYRDEINASYPSPRSIRWGAVK